MTAIVFDCTKCQARIEAPAAGGMLRCPQCGETLAVPAVEMPPKGPPEVHATSQEMAGPGGLPAAERIRRAVLWCRVAGVISGLSGVVPALAMLLSSGVKETGPIIAVTAFECVLLTITALLWVHSYRLGQKAGRWMARIGVMGLLAIFGLWGLSTLVLLMQQSARAQNHMSRGGQTNPPPEIPEMPALIFLGVLGLCLILTVNALITLFQLPPAIASGETAMRREAT